MSQEASDMVDIVSKIDLPMVQYDFDASYSHVDKLTGVQFLLLKIIGTKSFRNYTWKDVMDRIQVPDELFESIFKPCLGRLLLLKMITIDDSAMELDDTVGVVSFTNAGRQTFDRGVIAQTIESFRGSVVYDPSASKKKFASSLPRGIVEPSEDATLRYKDVKSDEYEIENYVIKSRKEYGVDDAEAEIFDFKFSEGSSLWCRPSDIRFRLSVTTGEFEVVSYEYDINFLKSKFNSKDLLPKIPLKVESIPDITIKNWRTEIPEWEQYSFLMPSTAKIGASDVVLLNSIACDSDRYRSSASVDGCDMVIIRTGESGSEYSFVERNAPISGFEETVSCRMMVSRDIGSERISEYIVSYAKSATPENVEALKEILRMVDKIHDEHLISDIVSDYIRKSPSVESALIELRILSKERWYGKAMPRIIEKMFVEKGTDINTVVSALSASELKIEGSMLIDSIGGDEQSKSVAVDILGSVSNNQYSLLHHAGLEQYLVESILSGSACDYRSKVLGTVSNLSKVLVRLKDAIGLKSLSDYSFDITTLNENVLADLTTFITDMNSVRKIVDKTRGYQELHEYEKFFKDVEGFLRNQHGNTDRAFGITLGVELEHILRSMNFSGDLDEMIRAAHDAGQISDSQWKNLDEFRMFRNRCAHDIELPYLESSKRKKWKATVKDISILEVKP